jgi:hypothetical protein
MAKFTVEIKPVFIQEVEATNHAEVFEIVAEQFREEFNIDLSNSEVEIQEKEMI